MVKTIQRKIISAYSLWLFAVFIVMVAYLLYSGIVFETYESAMPWILGYIALAVVGNIVMLIVTYKFLIPNQDGLKFLAGYEVIFILIMVFIYLIMYLQWIPDGYGNINFETLLNAVLPFMFILLILAEFVLSKALRLMPVKAV